MPTEPDNLDWDDERTTNRAAVGGVGAYNSYGQDHSYETDTGLVFLPLASRTPDFRVIRLHGGVQTRTINWQACRQGKPPIIPTPKDTAFDKFLGGTVTVGLPVPNKDNNGYNWTVTGSYTYIEAAPRVIGTDSLPTGFFPYPTDPMDETANTIYEGQQAEIMAALQDIAEAAAGDPPVPPNTAIGNIIETASNVNHVTDEYIWPFTFITKTFTTDTGFDT